MGVYLAEHITVALLLLTLLPIALSHIPAQSTNAATLPSSGAPNAVCISNSSIYVFGFDNSSGYPRLFAAKLSHKGFVERFYLGGFGAFYNCVMYRDMVIAVGITNTSSIAWLIAVFDSDLNLLGSVVEDLTPGVDVATHVMVSNSRIVVAGVGDKYGNAFIRVEERD